MLRLLDASAKITEKHRLLFRMANAAPKAPDQERRRQTPSVE